MKESGFVFDYWPTGSCDMKCPFCYGAKVPDFSQLIADQVGGKKTKMYLPTLETSQITNSQDARPEMTFEQVTAALTLLNNVGGETVTVAGGEPLMRAETPQIIDFAKNALGMRVYLSTNGTYVMDKYDQVKANIDVLGLPLDGSSVAMNMQMGRRPYLLKNIEQILAHLKAEKPDHLVKVGTVVSKINIDDVENTGSFLFENPKVKSPDVWRLYQFERIGRGVQSGDEYAVTDSEFSQVCDRIEQRFPQANVKPRSNETHFNAYFFLTPDGMLQAVDQNHHVSITDLTKSDESSLSEVIDSYKDTAARANVNREWLQTEKSTLAE